MTTSRDATANSRTDGTAQKQEGRACFMAKVI